MENPQTMRTKPTRAPSENRPLYGPSPKRAISAARGSRSVVRVWTPRNTTIPIRSVIMILPFQVDGFRGGFRPLFWSIARPRATRFAADRSAGQTAAWVARGGGIVDCYAPAMRNRRVAPRVIPAKAGIQSWGHDQRRKLEKPAEAATKRQILVASWRSGCSRPRA